MALFCESIYVFLPAVEAGHREEESKVRAEVGFLLHKYLYSLSSFHW